MTHLRAIFAVARKDARDIFLDRAKLANFLGPLALALIWFFISKVVGGGPTTLLVYNPGQSPLQQVLSGAYSDAQVVQANSAADVSAAFGPNGSSNKHAPYDIGLIIPAGFEQAVHSGGQPQVSLYVNESGVSAQQAALLQAAITNYARAVASPTPPIALTASIINPPSNAVSSLTLSKFYSVLALGLSFEIGLTAMPGLLIEEKEKKTLRMLMVSPASFGDVVVGKLLVVLALQFAISAAVVALLGGFGGNVPLTLVYLALGGLLAIAVGLIIGSLLNTAAALGGIAIVPVFVFIIPAIFVPLAPFIHNNPITQIIRFLPPYYVADGAYNAILDQGTFAGNVLDIGVAAGCVILAIVLTLWVLRRQSAVAAII